MKKAKKLGLQSLALVLMAFVLVAGVAFGMTGAWFTDNKETNTAQVTMGNKVDIDSGAITLTGNTDIYGNSGTTYAFPGSDLTVGGTFVMAADSASAWIKVVFEQVDDAQNSTKAITVDLTDLTLNGTAADANGIVITSYTGGASVTTEARTFTFGGTIAISGELDNGIAAKDVKIKATVYAIQKANVATSDVAFVTDDGLVELASFQTVAD